MKKVKEKIMVFKVKMLVSEHGLGATEITSYYATRLCENDLRGWLFERHKGYHTFIIKNIEMASIADFLTDNKLDAIELEV